MKPEPKFLSLDQILQLHKFVIDNYGGTHGVRDKGLLTSALAQPQVSFNGTFLLEDIHAMAASYLFHFVSNHAFIDGNKRIAALCASVFLEVNGYEMQASEDEFEKLVMDAAQGRASKDQISEFFRNNSKKLSE